MSDIRAVSWEEIFLQVMDETAPEKLAQLMPAVELAMFKRRQELADTRQNSEELSTMSVADEALRVVKHKIFKPVSSTPSTSDRPRFANFVRRSRTA